MAGAYAWAGLWGLLLLRVLLIAAVAVTLWHALRATKGPVESSLWAATVVVAASARYGVRPELFSLLFLTMTASLTLVLLRGRCTGRSFGVGVLVLFLLAAAWTHVHSGYLLGAAWVGLCAMGHLMDQRDGAAVKRVIVVVGVVAVALGIPAAQLIPTAAFEKHIGEVLDLHECWPTMTHICLGGRDPALYG